MQEDIDMPDISYEADEVNVGSTVVDDKSPKIYSDAGVSTIQAISMLLSWFAAFPGISKASFTRLLILLHDYILPRGNNFPRSYEDAIKLIKETLSPIKEYHCCVNDCVVFRKCSAGDYETLSKCPECEEDRYLPDTTSLSQGSGLSTCQ